MSQLQLTCLGELQVTLAGTLLTAFQTEKVQALLLYLAVQGQPQPRGELAQLLWPGYSEASANNSLRQTLHRLRQLLHDATSDPPWLLITRQTVQFNPAASIQVDTRTFTKLLTECTAHAHAQLVQCQPCCVRLRQAVDLYRGDFLAGFTVADSDPFEEWRRITQEKLHLQFVDSLTHLASAAEAAGDDEQALQDSRRQLGLEPWLEDAHRRVMRILAQRGQRTAAIAQYQRCRQVLAEELGVAPDQETTALVEQIQSGVFDKVMRRQGVRATTGASITSSPDHPVTPAHNLPLSTPLVGRTQAVAEIVSQLHLPGVRLLTLRGPGGIGKTRLAVEIGRELLTAFADGVFFVPLDAINTPATLVPAIAAAIGLTLQGEPRTALLQALHQKQMLLILDNFEHLLVSKSDGVDLVVDLLSLAPAVQILVTSRERLKLRSEQLYSVQALAFSPNATLAEAAASPAVRLFIQCVHRIQADFQLTPGNLPAVLRICALVQGMPLGLEMAAAWYDVLSLDEIANEIEHSLDFLAVDHYDLPERQRSMRAVLDWSWRLLAEDEALVLRQLAVFRGGFTRQAAETICGATLRVLNGLVDKSVLRRSLDTSDNSGATIGRYEFHPLLWQFAQEKLNSLPDERAKSAIRHSDFYLAFVAERKLRMMRHEPRQAMMEIQAELDNVRQAWRWAVDTHAGEMLDLGAYGLWQFYLLTSLTAEAVEAFGQAVTALMSPPAEGQAESTTRQQQHILSKLLALSAHLLTTYGNHDEATVNAQRAITLATVERTEATSQQVAVLGRLVMGQALYKKSQFSESQACLEQVLQAVQDEMAPDEMAPDELWPEIGVMVRLYLAAIARTHGNFALAYNHLADALHLCQQGGKLRAEVRVQMNLGATARSMRDERRARQAYEQALPLTIDLHDRWGEGVVRHELGEVVRELGEYSLALTLCQQALSIFVDINERLGQAYSLAELIELSTYLGQFEWAGTYRKQLASLLQQIKAPDAERESLVASTILALYQGDDERALICAQQLWQLVQPMNSPIFQAETLILLGHAQSRLYLQAAAAESYTEALTLYQSLNAPAQGAEALTGLADLALAQGDHTQALQFTETVLATLEQHPNVGLHEPFSTYLTCYRVLTATHDCRARTFLKKAHALLQHYAAHIDDGELRDSFLQNVSVHRQLVVAYDGAPKPSRA